MNKFKKAALLSALSLTIVTACTAGPMAIGFRSGNSFEIAAEEYADDVEKLVEDTGKAYKDATESYPENAQNNPNAPSEYLQTVIKLGSDYLSRQSGLLKGFLGR